METHLPAITRIYDECVRNGVASYEIDPPDEAEMHRRLDAVVSADYPWIVALIDEQVVGYAYANAFRTRPAYRWLVEDSIYLAPGFRGQGIGLELLERLIGLCTDRGFRQMVAVIGGAEPASVALHARAGFELSGTMKASGFKFGRWLDTVFMQRALGPGDETLPS